MSPPAALLMTLLAARCAPAEAPPPTAPDRPWSLQLHVHGSLSEGDASWEQHTVQAEQHSVDVLWWSDHDWLMGQHQLVDRYDFEEPPLAEARRGASATAVKLQRGQPARCEVARDGRGAEGASAVVRLEGGRGDGCGVGLNIDGQRDRAPAAAAPRYELALRPEPGGWGPARLIINLRLSHHPAQPTGSELLGGQAPAARYRLQYVYPLSGEPQRLRHRLETSEPVMARVEVWDHYSDADPDTPGADPGEPLIFSNPVVLHRALPEGGLPRGRAGLLVGGYTLSGNEGVSLQRVQHEEGALVLEGQGAAVPIGDEARTSRLTLSPIPRGATVSIEGEGALWAVQGEVLAVWNLSGPFRLAVTP